MPTSPEPEPLMGEASCAVFGRTEGGAIVKVTAFGAGSDDVVRGLLGGDRPDWWPAFGLEPIADLGELGDEGSTGAVEFEVRVEVGVSSSVDRAESDLGLFAVEHLTDWVAVHAALVRVDDVVIAVPGPSHAGKSTLCGAVLEAGGEVLSDEYTLVAPDGSRARGWPRQVRLRDAELGFRRVGEASGAEVEHVDLVAIVSFDPGCTESLEVETIPPAELVTDVLANTVCAASRPRFAFDAVVALCRVVPGVRGRRGPAVDALGALVGEARQRRAGP